VLLVDDDDSLRRALARTLRLEGFDVTGYASVEELLAAGVPERNACPVLVLDVNLPGIDGIAFKRALVEAGRDLPTVFITALEPEDVSGPLAALAPVAVLFKPFKNEDLLAAIGRAGACFGSTRTDGGES
jgi:FixJ family two-component response regulator